MFLRYAHILAAAVRHSRLLFACKRKYSNLNNQQNIYVCTEFANDLRLSIPTVSQSTRSAWVQLFDGLASLNINDTLSHMCMNFVSLANQTIFENVCDVRIS